MKNIKNIVFITLAMLSFTTAAYSQDFRPAKNYPTPEAAGLGTFGNVPVSMYTGTPNISIPLYEITEGDISIPITLSYHLANVKPNQHPGWTGLGWSLMAGGYISRSVKGAPDELQYNYGRGVQSNGFYERYAELRSVTNATTLHNKTLRSGTYTGNEANPFELMADEFSFGFGAYSGKFYRNEQGGWTVVSDHQIKVEFSETDGFRRNNQLRSEINTTSWHNKESNLRFFDKFTLVTPDGCKYVFGGQNATEYCVSYYNRNNSNFVATTWYLTEIITPEERKITFQYKAGKPNYEIRFSPQQTEINPNNPNGIPLNSQAVNGRKMLSGFLNFPVYLDKITANTVTVSFISSPANDITVDKYFLYWGNQSGSEKPAHDIFDPSREEPWMGFHTFMDTSIPTTEYQKNFEWRKLDAVQISSTSFSKYFQLNYINNPTERLKLSSIKETPGTYPSTQTYNEPGPLRSYSFEYDTQNKMPRYLFAREDHWGYLNSTEPYPYATGIPFLNGQYEKSKNPSAILAKAETLKTIHYPTGGRVTFEYEMNDYSKHVTPSATVAGSNGTGGGLRVAKITTYTKGNNISSTKNYYYTNDEVPGKNFSNSSGILKAKPIYKVGYSFARDNSPGSLGINPNPSTHDVIIDSASGFTDQGTNSDGVHVGYSSVIEETLGSDGASLGYIRYRFTNHDNDIWGNSHLDEKPMYATFESPTCYTQRSSKSMERGKLVAEDWYNKDYKLVKTIRNKYQKTSDDYFKTAHQSVYLIYRNHYGEIFLSTMYKTYTYSYLLQKTTETLYNPATGAAMQSTTREFSYNSIKLLSSEKTWNSKGEPVEVTYKYPADFASSPYQAMTLQNQQNTPIEKVTYVNGKVTAGEITEYGQVNLGNTARQSYRPTSTWLLEIITPISDYVPYKKSRDKRYKKHITYERYDLYGNPRVITESTLTTTYLWGYKGLYPVAKIENANLTEVSSKLTGGVTLLDQLTDRSLPTTDDISKLNALRSLLPNAQVTTYTFSLPEGVTSITDPRGFKTTYSYVLGRLNAIYINEDGTVKPLQLFDANYQNQ